LSKQGVSKPFSRMFLIFADQDYKFPTPEIFAALLVLTILLTGSLNSYAIISPSGLAIAYSYAQLVAPITVLVFMIIIVKNVSIGFGGDLEKGTIQTYLGYPLSRNRILMARLLSSVGIALLLLVLIQFTVLFMLAPAFFISNLSMFSLVYLGVIGNALLITSVMLLIVSLTRQGTASVMTGLLLYLLFGFLPGMLTSYFSFNDSYAGLVAALIFNPVGSFQPYYWTANNTRHVLLWAPSFWNVVSVIATNYALTAIVTGFCFLYFSRRLEV